jgi:RNA polymerase sigma-70 factor (ECF subfamily)
MKGIYFLREASKGSELSKYHLEAGIGYWHTIKSDTREKWDNILQLYNKLLVVEYSPVAALNRTYALSKVKGKEAAITEAEKLNLTTNHFYFTLLGELYSGINNKKADENFRKALSLAKTETETQMIQKRLKEIS